MQHYTVKCECNINALHKYAHIYISVIEYEMSLCINLKHSRVAVAFDNHIRNTCAQRSVSGNGQGTECCSRCMQVARQKIQSWIDFAFFQICAVDGSEKEKYPFGIGLFPFLFIACLRSSTMSAAGRNGAAIPSNICTVDFSRHMLWLLSSDMAKISATIAAVPSKLCQHDNDVLFMHNKFAIERKLRRSSWRLSCEQK